MVNNSQKGTVKRPPIVVVMGHIDHGKSTLLDYIRKANTVKKEAGGITQHMGAYEALYKDKTGAEHRLTFIDTPGHEAFCSIRERGARTADLAILVVSAEDGVKPQTLEALSCIKESNIPYVVAINKIDRPGVDVEKTKASLAEHEIYVEGYGGDISFVPISALTGQGIPDLLEILALMAELQDLKTSPAAKASGIIIEAYVDQKRGTTATLIIKNGRLSVGEFVTAGDAFSPVRAIVDSAGDTIKTAQASNPVRIVGWSKVPIVGMEFSTVSSKKDAEMLVAQYKSPAVIEKIPAAETAEGAPKVVVVPLIIKADAVGSLDAIVHEIAKISVEGIMPKILSASVGTINENDLKTASAGQNPIVMGFNVKVDASAKAIAERLKIPVMNFDIIYRLTEWLVAEIEKRRPRISVEEETGRAKILKLFSAEKDRYVIGGKVESGTLSSGAVFKLMRRDAEVSRGKVRNLQQQKVKVDEVAKGNEFGAMVESKIEPAPGDRIEVFTVNER